MTSDNPHDIDFEYKKYSLNHVDEWVSDALNCEQTTPQEIYDTIIKCVSQSVEYHSQMMNKSVELLNLFTSGAGSNVGICSLTGPDSKEPIVTEGTKKDWVEFWEGHDEPLDKDLELLRQRREYNLREAEYYNKRAKLDAEYEAIKAAGGYEWTPEA